MSTTMSDNPKKPKLNLTSIKTAPQPPEDPAAVAFVAGAAPVIAKAPRAHDTYLIVEGYLKARRETCRPPMQLYLKNDIADWIDQHTIAGRGGAQIVINYLLQRGIDAINGEYTPGNPVIAHDDT